MTPPLPKTLEKYGLTVEAFKALWERQGGTCAVCKAAPKSREVPDSKRPGFLKHKTSRLCIDHAHVKGWKKMPPEKRARHVRGLLCYWCNTCYVGRAITIEKSQAVTEYLRAFESKAAQ